MLLAAGTARRFGATKQVARFEGRPLVVHAVEVARRAGADRVLVVVGHDAETVVASLPGGRDVEVVHNPEFVTGQSTSLAAGLRAADRKEPGEGVWDVAVILLADQPGISPDVVREVGSRARAQRRPVRTRYSDGPGHPVALPRRLWGPVADRVSGDAGMRQLFAELEPGEVVVDGPAPADVDRPGDLDPRDPDSTR